MVGRRNRKGHDRKDTRATSVMAGLPELLTNCYELRGDEDIEGAVQDCSEKMISFKEEEEFGAVKFLKRKYESCL